jgi:dTDP-4-amino-4,6-dideoxygalactose transaminase
LADLPIKTPVEDGIGVHVYHQYTLLSDQRERIMSSLTEAGIASAIYYPVPLHQQNVFKEACQGLSLPVTESVASQCFSLPIYPELENEKVDQIVEVIRSAIAT